MRKAVTSILALALAGFLFSGVVSMFQVALKNIDDTIKTTAAHYHVIKF